MFSLTRVTIEVIDQMVRPATDVTLQTGFVTLGLSWNFRVAVAVIRKERQGFIARNIGTLLIYLTIIPRRRVGYEMIDSQRGA